MKSSSTSISQSIPVESLEEIDRICTGFDEAWRDKKTPLIEQFWTQREGEVGQVLFRELLSIELERRGNDETIVIEEYLNRFPDQADLIQSHDFFQEQLHPTSAVQNNRTTQSTRFSVQDIPGYEVLETLGHGGMGYVVKARQKSLGRLVALKLIREELRATEEGLKRFRAEAEVLAQLQHPNIIQIYDVGEYQGNPYLALEYVEGGDLNRQLAGSPVPPSDAVRMTQIIARALHDMHQVGIIHRDLKPANILLVEGTKTTDQESAECRLPETLIPRITDFGLARSIQQSGLTQTGEVLGTPQYMAPEQVCGLTDQVGPVTDVYALGMMLYEMLTGRPAFKGTTPVETIQQIVYTEPVPPSKLRPNVPKDLDTICLKAINKDPKKRFNTALALAEDLERFTQGKPILARPTGMLERAMKWVKRRPWVAGLLILLVIVTLVGAFGIVLEAGRARRAETREKSEKLEARRQMVRAQKAEAEMRRQMVKAKKGWANNRIMLAEASLKKGQVQIARTLLDSIPENLRYWEWYYLQASLSGALFTCYGHTNEVTCVAFSSTGAHVASTSRDGTIRIYDARTGELLRVVIASSSDVGCLQFSPNGKWLASGSKRGEIRIWEVMTGKLIREFPRQALSINDLAFRPDGTHLVTGTMGSIKVWNAFVGRERLTMKGRIGFVNSVAYSPDGKKIVTAGSRVQIWDGHTGALLQELRRALRQSVSPSLFSPGGRYLLSHQNELVQLRDASTGTKLIQFSLDGKINCYRFSFSPNGEWLAVTDADNSITIREVRSGKTLRRLSGHEGVIRSIAWSPDGQRIVTGSSDCTVRFWDARGFQNHFFYPERNRAVHTTQFLPDGTLMTGADRGTIRFWKKQGGQLSRSIPGPGFGMHSCCVSSDYKTLAMANRKRIHLWDLETSHQHLSLHNSKESWGRLTLSSNGRYFVTTGIVFPQKATLYQVRDGRAIWEIPEKVMSAAAITPDGKYLAFESGSIPNTITLWSIQDRKRSRIYQGHTRGIKAINFTPNGSKMITTSYDSTVRIWEVESGKLLLTLRGHSDSTTNVSLSPDGNRLASASSDGTVRIWDPESGEMLITLRSDSTLQDVCFSPDGRWLCAASNDATVQFWHAPRRIRTTMLGEPATRSTCLAFSKDSHFLASGEAAGEIKIWSTLTRKTVRKLKAQAGRIHCVCFSPDGTYLAVSAGSSTISESTVLVWNLRNGTSTLRERSPRAISEVVLGVGGKRLAILDQNNTLRVTDLHVEEPVLEHRSSFSLSNLALSHNEQQVLAMSRAGTLAWDLTTGEQVQAIKQMRYPTMGVESPDGRWLALRSTEGPPRLIDISPLSAEEKSIRIQRAAVDVRWQLSEAMRNKQQKRWFASAFHLEQVRRAHFWDASLYRHLADVQSRLNLSKQSLKNYLRTWLLNPSHFTKRRY